MVITIEVVDTGGWVGGVLRGCGYGDRDPIDPSSVGRMVLGIELEDVVVVGRGGWGRSKIPPLARISPFVILTLIVICLVLDVVTLAVTLTSLLMEGPVVERSSVRTVNLWWIVWIVFHWED
jgi:hypothetical protein